jgi:hypothetical protein
VANDQIADRKATCSRFGVKYFAAPDDQFLAISLNVREGAMPLNGCRFKPEGDQTGWFIWGGEDTHHEDDRFYKSLHVSHINNWSPLVSKYLGLPPGWRFLVADGYEDVWFDTDVLNAPPVLPR